MVREQLLRMLDDEVPHGIAVMTESMTEREEQDILDISVVIYCERESHKGIVIGKRALCSSVWHLPPGQAWRTFSALK